MAKDSMNIRNVGLISKASAEAAAGYEAPKSATAETVSGNDAPTIGKAIPIIAGGARPNGEVIWCQTRRDKNNECRGDIAVCFGRNAFGRALSLAAVSIDGSDVYSRKNGVTIDPPDAIRFYDGTQTTADPLIASVEGAANTPAFKGYIYAVLENIKLADGIAVAADFTDAEDPASNVSYSFECDSELTGINMVKDFETGWYYGIKNPMTTESYFVRSLDGCQIFDKKRITWPPIDGGQFKICYDNIFPLRCSDVIVVVSHRSTGPFGSPSFYEMLPNLQFIMDPSAAELSVTVDLVELHDYRSDPYAYVFGPGGSIPEDPYADYIESYPLPGFPTQFCVLRKFNRSNTTWNYYWGPYGYGHDTSGGNICGSIIDIKASDSSYIKNDLGGPEGASMETVIVSPRGTPYPTSTQTNAYWDLYGIPTVDKIIYCKSEASSVLLAGAVQSGDDIVVYRILHQQSGITITNTTTLTDITVPLTLNGIGYDGRVDTILVSAQPGANPSTSSAPARLYQVTSLGFYSYVEADAPRVSIVDRRNANSIDGATALANEDFSKIYSFDAETEEITEIYNGSAPSNTPIIDMARNSISLPTVTGRTAYSFSQVNAGDIALSDLITDICALKGYSPSDLVFEGFSGLVARGMTISSTTRVSDLLNRIGRLYDFVFAETDGKLKFRRRRQSSGSITPDVSLDESDLIEGSENITVQRQAATTVLNSLSLTWLDPDRDYESNSLVARRITGVLSGETAARDEEISLPVAVDQATARSLLFQSFYAQTEGETRVSFSVGPSHLRIEPGDIVSITAAGATRLVQARRVTHRADLNTLEIEADTFMAQATPTIGSAGGNTSTPTANDIAGAYIHLDIPLIRTADYPGVGYVRQYHGITTFSAESWGGADLYVSPDGVTFTKVLDYDVQPMVVGIAQNALGDCPQNYAIDETSQLTIAIEAGDPAEFASVSSIEQLADLTLCAYGVPGKWELISFQNVTDNLDGTLTLSNLQRGLYGTQKLHYSADLGGAGDSHEVGDYVCLLRSVIRSTARSNADMGKLDCYAVATADVGIETAVKSWREMNPAAMNPPPVANVLATHTGSSSNLVITWDEVSPIPNQWEDNGTAATLPEVYDYDITVIGVDSAVYTGSVSGTNTWTWTGYGSAYGASSSAPQKILNVIVTAQSPVYGGSYPTSAYEIRQA